MKIKKVKTIFQLSEKEFWIGVCINHFSNTMTLKTYTGHEKFWFEKSKPEIVEKIGKLMYEAGKKFKELNE